jgi:hypothetical protein
VYKGYAYSYGLYYSALVFFPPLSHLTDVWGPHVSGFFNLPPSLSSHALSRTSRPNQDQRLRLGARSAPPSSPSLLVPPCPCSPPRAPLLLLPFAGGGGSRAWPTRLGEPAANEARARMVEPATGGARSRPRWGRPWLAELTADGGRQWLAEPATGGARPRLGLPMAGGARGRRRSRLAFHRRNPSPGTRARPWQAGHWGSSSSVGAHRRTGSLPQSLSLSLPVRG